MLKMLTALLCLSFAQAAIIDNAGPTDTAGRPQVDLYDATGAQRGTVANPIYTRAISPPTFSSKVLTGNTTTTLKTGAGLLQGIVIGNNGTAGTINVYDGTSASGTLLFSSNAGSPAGGLLSSTGIGSAAYLGPLAIAYTTGLTVVTSGSSSNSFTVVYQ